MRNPQIVILAAGLGTRLGLSSPKPLTALADGQTIMQRQLVDLKAALPEAHVMVVVGHQAELIMRADPHLAFAYNHRFEGTNTAKSLLLALRLSPPGGVLWLNGDVVFEHGLLELIDPMIKADESFVCVNTAAVGDEEVTYTLDRDGYIVRLAKALIGGLGEAVGINYVRVVGQDDAHRAPRTMRRPGLLRAGDRVCDRDGGNACPGRWTSRSSSWSRWTSLWISSVRTQRCAGAVDPARLGLGEGYVDRASRLPGAVEPQPIRRAACAATSASSKTRKATNERPVSFGKGTD